MVAHTMGTLMDVQSTFIEARVNVTASFDCCSHSFGCTHIQVVMLRVDVLHTQFTTSPDSAGTQTGQECKVDSR